MPLHSCDPYHQRPIFKNIIGLRLHDYPLRDFGCEHCGDGPADVAIWGGGYGIGLFCRPCFNWLEADDRRRREGGSL